ncbi:MAG: hypothetical protein ACMZI2_01280 [Candidatus Symbiodolus clandestinus]
MNYLNNLGVGRTISWKTFPYYPINQGNLYKQNNTRKITYYTQYPLAYPGSPKNLGYSRLGQYNPAVNPQGFISQLPNYLPMSKQFNMRRIVYSSSPVFRILSTKIIHVSPLLKKYQPLINPLVGTTDNLSVSDLNPTEQKKFIACYNEQLKQQHRISGKPSILSQQLSALKQNQQSSRLTLSQQEIFKKLQEVPLDLDDRQIILDENCTPAVRNECLRSIEKQNINLSIEIDRWRREIKDYRKSL